MTAMVPLLVVLYEWPALYRYYAVNAAEIPDFNFVINWIGGFALFAFLTTLTREIIKDIEDFEGDSAYGRNTLPVVIGVMKAKIAAVILIIITIVLLYFTWYFFVNDTITLFYMSAVITLPLLYIIFMVIRSKGKKQLHTSSRLMKIVMLTGDRWATANAVTQELGLDEVHAELLPDGKVSVMEQLSAGVGKVMFVGDGINDAPVLARADIGVAMGALGSDAAIEAADVVLMTDELARLPAAILVSRRTRAIVWQNIGLSFCVKALVLTLGGLGIAGLWEAVFADVGVALLAVLNSLRVLRAPTVPDNAPSPL
jgi:soluble P-type ATPase